MVVFWVVAPCSLVEVTDVSEVFAASIIRAMTLMMEAASTFETLVNFYQTTWCYNPEDSHLIMFLTTFLLHIPVSYMLVYK
jgi:hypothetical protein